MVCEHQDCVSSLIWEARRNFRNSRAKHWNLKHSKSETLKCKVVSYWSTEKTGESTNLCTEYRLVDEALKYIVPGAQRRVDLDVNSPVDADSEHSDDDFAEEHQSSIPPPDTQWPPHSVRARNDNTHNRKRNVPPSTTGLHWYVSF